MEMLGRKLGGKFLRDKGAEMAQVLVYIIIAVIILVVVVTGIIILAKKDVSFIEFIKNLFIFRK